MTSPANQRKPDIVEELTDITFSSGVLDRIDRLVAPGLTVNPDGTATAHMNSQRRHDDENNRDRHRPEVRRPDTKR